MFMLLHTQKEMEHQVLSMKDIVKGDIAKDKIY